jgi:phospholipase C
MKTIQKASRSFSVQNSPISSHRISRRRFLETSTALMAGFAIPAEGALSVVAARRNRHLPMPQRSGIEHIVVLMMENRSFDHFLGWLPGAERRQSGLTYPDRAGVMHATAPLAPDYQGCSHPNPDHSYEGGRIEFNGGACDGWLRAGSNDDYAIGYYVQDDLPFLGNAARAWTTCDHYFSAILSATYPNRIYQHAAQTDRLDGSILPFSTLPTIWDRLAEGGISARYYYSDVPFLGLWGTKYLDIVSPIDEFFAASEAGTLPHVSFVEPRLLGEAAGQSNDDHPHADIRNGEAFLNSVYEAIISSPNWPNTVFVINFDEWGGFFDHVPPPLAPVPPADAALHSDGRRGFRVPALVISPWSRHGPIARGLYDHTSVLKMIEWRWDLPPLTIRDSTANNLAEVLNFMRPPNLNPPHFAVPDGPGPSQCPGTANGASEWEELAVLALQAGFHIIP